MIFRRHCCDSQGMFGHPNAGCAVKVLIKKERLFIIVVFMFSCLCVQTDMDQDSTPSPKDTKESLPGLLRLLLGGK